MQTVKPTIAGVMWAIALLAFVMAILRGAITPPIMLWIAVLMILVLPSVIWLWFTAVPHVSEWLLRDNPRFRRRVLRWVVSTPFGSSGVKVLARFRLAILDQVEGRYKDAEAEFRAMLDGISDGRAAVLESGVRQRLADTLEALGRRDEAEAERARARRSLHDPEETHLALQSKAKQLEREHRYSEAYDLHELSLARLSGNLREARLLSMMHLVLSSFNAGRPDDTLNWAQTIIETYPDWPDIARARKMAAVAYSSMGRLEEAEHHARAAVEQAASDQERVESLGLCADYILRRGNLDRAEQVAREAEALNPGKKQTPWLVIASVAKARGRFEESIDALERARSIPLGSIRAYNRRMAAVIDNELALVHAELGHGDTALALIHKAQPELAKVPKLGVRLDATAALVHAVEGERAEALSLIASVEARRQHLLTDWSTQCCVLHYLAKAALKLGEYERSEDFLRAYLELGPDSLFLPNAYFYMAECRRNLGDVEGGREYDRRAASSQMGTYHERLARERLESEGIPV